MTVKIEKISAITLKVADMQVPILFYRDVLGMELVYGGKDASTTSNKVLPLLAGAE